MASPVWLSRSARAVGLKTGNPGWDKDGVGVFSPALDLKDKALSDEKRSALAQAIEAMKG